MKSLTEKAIGMEFSVFSRNIMYSVGLKNIYLWLLPYIAKSVLV